MQQPAGSVAAVLPEHQAAEAVAFHVLAFVPNRFFILVGDEVAPVKKVWRFRFFIPIAGISILIDIIGGEFGEVRSVPPAVPDIWRYPLLRSGTCCQLRE